MPDTPVPRDAFAGSISDRGPGSGPHRTEYDSAGERAKGGIAHPMFCHGVGGSQNKNGDQQQPDLRELHGTPRDDARDGI
jgi:hypothetical protein